MRSEKELLELVLENIDLLSAGLCGLIRIEMCFDKNIISLAEKNILLKIIEENIPEGASIDWFFWTEGIKEPRIEYLKELIKKYSNES